MVHTSGILLSLVTLCALASVSCVESGFPSLDEQLDKLGVPRDLVVTVNAQTRATVHLNDGQPELVIFEPYRFGGWEPHAWPPDKATVAGGQVGHGASIGTSTDSGFEHGFQYLFGAGQGPLSRVALTNREARSKVVDPEIGGWVIVFPETLALNDIEWDLIGADGVVLYSGRGLNGR